MKKKYIEDFFKVLGYIGILLALTIIAIFIYKIATGT